MVDSPFWIYPLLFVTGVASGLVDSIAGGGGVISLPVLLNLGLPVSLALGTNKFQACFGSVSAAFHYGREGLIGRNRTGILMTAAGALAGAYVVRSIGGSAMEKIIPWLLGAIVVYSLFRPQLGAGDHPPQMRAGLFFTVFGLGLGFYDGFFGPGTGSFWMLALVMLQGVNFVKATACTKLMNATSNIASLVFFATGGQVDYLAGVVMGAGQLAGAKLGTGMVIKKGSHFIRPIFLTMATLTVLRLLYVSYIKSK